MTETWLGRAVLHRVEVNGQFIGMSDEPIPSMILQYARLLEAARAERDEARATIKRMRRQGPCGDVQERVKTPLHPKTKGQQ